MNSIYKKVESCDPRQCIALKIMKSHRIINSIFRKHFKPFGLTNSQMSMLFILSKRGKTTQTVLSNDLCLEKSTISRNLQRLFKDGAVSRAAFPTIEITDKGLALLESIIPHWEKAMEESKMKLGEEGLDALNIVLTTLTKKDDA